MRDMAAILDRVTAATLQLALAEAEYRAALLASLEAGAGYAGTARAAGITRQAVQAFAIREWPAGREKLFRARRKRARRQRAEATVRAAGLIP